MIGALALLALGDAPAQTPNIAAQEPGRALPMPWLRLDFSRGSLVLSGAVPNPGERDAVVAWARSTYGSGRVVSSLAVAEVANPSWLHTAYLPDLRQTRHAVALLSDAGLVIEGAAPDRKQIAVVARSTERALVDGLRVVNRLVAP